ncbi:MAG: hypothetical protein ACTHJS_03390 [Xanthobacteraceae bacterium]
MTAHAIDRAKQPRGRAKPLRGRAAVLSGPFLLVVVLVAAAASCISYLLWPTWPSDPLAGDAPALPVTVGGVLFEVPPAAIRAKLQRQPGQHERIDLVLSWPDLSPPNNRVVRDSGPIDEENATAALAEAESDRLFVSIVALTGVLPPLERLRTIYPRYLAAQATAGQEGLAVLPFRSGTPYAGEDLVYPADNPEQFFARCTHAAGPVPGTCISERALGGAQITIRFPRDWLSDWRNVAAGFDRLTKRLHPQNRDKGG